MSHKKFGPDRFSRFDVYWIQTDRKTNKQTNKQRDKQAKFIYRCKTFCIKIVGFNRSYTANQFENNDIPEEPKKLRVASIII